MGHDAVWEEQQMRWFRARKTDSVSVAVLTITLLQLLIGVCIVRTLSAQSQDVINAQLEFRQQTLDTRISEIEHLNLPARLAVLEQTAADLGQVKMLIYGVIVTLFGSLAAQIIQIRGQRSNRRPGGE